MKRPNFLLLSAIARGNWHIHQASGIGLMPLAISFMTNQIQAYDDDDFSKRDTSKISERGQRFVENFNAYSPEPYVSTADTWYYDHFPVKLGNVLVIPVIGAITQEDYCGTAGTKTIIGWYEKAKADKSIQSILEVKNTPGGDVLGTGAFADYKIGYPKPIVGFCEGMECSAGMYIGAGDDYKFATRDSIVGSIGVMTTFVNWKGWYEKNGIKVESLYSKESPLKNDAYRKAVEGDFKGYTDGILFKFDSSFMEFIQTQRPNASKKALQGAEFIGKEAIEAGLIDEIGSFEAAYQKALSMKEKSQKSAINQNSNMKTVKMNVPSFLVGGLKIAGATEIENGDGEDNNDAQAEGSETATGEQAEGSKTKPEGNQQPATPPQQPAQAAEESPEFKAMQQMNANLMAEIAELKKTATGKVTPRADADAPIQVKGKEEEPKLMTGSDFIAASMGIV
jgi:ClpP class serine protease